MDFRIKTTARGLPRTKAGLQQRLKVYRTTFLALVITFGVISLGFGVWWGVGEQSRQWPTTPGTISQSTYTQNSNTYQIYINYTYSVGGQEYVSDTIWWGMGTNFETSSWAFVSNLLEKYPAGSTVDVRYNPEYPDQSALEAGASVLPLILMASFGGVTIIITFAAVILQWKVKRDLFLGNYEPEGPGEHSEPSPTM